MNHEAIVPGELSNKRSRRFAVQKKTAPKMEAVSLKTFSLFSKL